MWLYSVKVKYDLGMLLYITCCLAALSVSRAAVLDPALFLSPSPPLAGNPVAAEHWARAFNTEELSKAPVDPVEQGATTVEELEPPRARTFWSIQPTNYGIRGIHIPLTFSLSGTYGANPGVSAGVIGSSYASASDDSALFNYGKSGLAGSSYGLYRSGVSGTRIYGGAGGTAWSGWGNGKWGHYGKG